VLSDAITTVRSVLLVRNGVDHDARVLRAARVAEQTLGAASLVVGTATPSSPAGSALVEGVQVLRLPARPRPLRRTPGRGPGSGVDVPDAPRTNARLRARGRLRRILSGLSFTLQALSLARRVRPELVHANDWNTMWSGLAIKLCCRARLVYDSHELWPDRNGRWEWRPWLLASEALFVRAADEVITASPGYADVLSKRYRVPRPTVVRNIPDGPLSGVCATGQPSTDSLLTDAPRARTGQQQTPLIVYIGGLMPGRGLEQTIDALALAPTMRLRAVGPGSQEYRSSLLARAVAAGVADRLELREPVPPTAVAGALDGATAGLCLIQPVCRSYELTLPNKLFEYAAAGVPVLASDLPVIATVVRAEQLGEVVAHDDPRGIAAGLQRLAEPARWSEAARRSHTFARVNGWQGESRVLARAYARALARGASNRPAEQPRSEAGAQQA
jgi:glycosyltransferase involved in cell wall biosynthesis